MKYTKISALLFFGLIITQAAWSSSDAPPKVAATPAPLTAIVLSPDTVRVHMLRDNLSLIEEFNNVQDAKDTATKARLHLFPAINAQAMMSGASSFFVSSFQFLAPFAIPSNWFDYRASKHHFEAEKIAYYIMELNTYSSALSLYFTVQADKQILSFYEEQCADLTALAKIGGDRIKSGTVNLKDLLPVINQAHLSCTTASENRANVGQEISVLKEVLALPLQIDITFSNASLTDSPWQSKSAAEIFQEAEKVAPEHKQVVELKTAAKDEFWSNVFSFITSATVGSSGASGKNGNASISRMTGGVNGTIGLDYGPMLKISKRHQDEVALLDTQITQDNQKTVDGAVQQLVEDLIQLKESKDAEDGANVVYNISKSQIVNGTGNFVDLYTSLVQFSQATVGRVYSEMNVNLQRTIFHRMFMTDQFALIKGCQNTVDPSQVKHKGKLTMDDLCRQTN